MYIYIQRDFEKHVIIIRSFCPYPENYADELERKSTDAESSINMCIIEGARLDNHTITTFTARSVLICITICSRRPDCMSINYHLVDRTCDMNDKAAANYQAILDFHTHHNTIWCCLPVCIRE